MKIFKNIRNSIYSPQFYQELLSKPISFSFRYFILFALLFSVLSTVFFSFRTFGNTRIVIEDFVPEIINYYPQELKITIKDGQVSTNVPEPYFIPMPPQTNSEQFSDKDLDYFLVIDTKNDFSIEQFRNYKTSVWLTGNSIVSYSKQGINIQPIEKNFNFYIDKQLVNSIYEKVKPFFKAIYPLIILFIFLGSFVAIMLHAIYMLFGAIVVWLAYKIRAIKIGYKKAYQIGLHLITAIIIIRTVFIAFGVYDMKIPLFFTILLFIWALLNIKKNSQDMLINQSGQIAKLMLALVIVCFVAVLIAYFVINSANKPPAPSGNGEEIIEVPKAVYEITAHDIKITFQETTNFGNTLFGSASNNSNYQKNLTTTEKFVLVKIGGQNKGKADTPNNVWDLGNIIDSEGRNFKPSDYSFNSWLPKNNACGDVLKPEFTPLSCSKIYEVSKISQGLKVEVLISQKESDGKYNNSKKDTLLLDLIVNDK